MTNNFKRLLKILGIFSLFLIILGYAYYRSRDLLNGIHLEINGLENGQSFEEGYIQISGKARKAKHLTLNGRELFLDDNWRFKEDLLLAPGYNLIALRTEDKFGKIKEESYQVIYK